MFNRAIYRQVAQLHASGISEGFLSSLGLPFLTLLYEAIDADEKSVLIIIESNGLVLGFVAGTEHGMRSIYYQLLRRTPHLCWALLPYIFSLRKLLKIIEILRLSRHQTSRVNWPDAELLSIAVHSSALRQSHARTLYKSLVKHFHLRGVSSFKIVVGESLAAAHNFYSSMGAVTLQQIEVHKDQTSVLYIHTVND